MSMIAWGVKMIAHPKAAQELSLCLQAIQPIMTDAKVSREEKRKTLSMMVDELSEETFKLEPVAEQVMTIVNMKQSVCEEYIDSEAQMKGILVWLPRMKQHEKLLLNEVKKHRKEYKLKV